MNPKKSLVYDGGFHQEATSNGISSHCCRQQAGSHNPGFQRACGLLLLIPEFHEHNICICNISLNNRAKAVTQPFKRINKIIAMAKVQFFFVHVQASPRVVHLTLSFSVGTFFFSLHLQRTCFTWATKQEKTSSDELSHRGPTGWKLRLTGSRAPHRPAQVTPRLLAFTAPVGLDE